MGELGFSGVLNGLWLVLDGVVKSRSSGLLVFEFAVGGTLLNQSIDFVVSTSNQNSISYRSFSS